MVLLRLRFRDSFEQPVLMTPMRSMRSRIEAFPTSNLFAAGHRIRLDIASSNFPHFDVNPNTGAPAARPAPPIMRTNVIHLGPDRPSRIELPSFRSAPASRGGPA
jgi:predicted acyl esterase